MPLFNYRSVDRDGLASDGQMEESSAHRVTMILEERGLQVNEVKRVGERPGFLRRRARLTWEDLDLFNEQLLAITKSRLPLAESLRTLAKDAGNRRLRRVFGDVRRDIEAGKTLEEALTGHVESFSPTYLSAIRAGERTGNLSGVLSHLSTHSARMMELKSTVQEAVAYPLVVLVMSLAVIGFMLVRVVPEFGEMLGEFGAEVPWATKFWLNVSRAVVSHSDLILIGTAVLFGFTFYILKTIFNTQSGGFALDWFKLHLGTFGRLYAHQSMASFTRTLGLLLSSRVPLPESLDLAGAGAGNAVLRRAALEVTEDVERGMALSDAFERSGYFAETFCWLMALGEERGEVNETLMSLAETYERGAARWNRLVSVLTGPVLVAIVGFIIGSIVISLYLPILTMADAMSGA
jgi:type IV pilus assembly protein PilC